MIGFNGDDPLDPTAKKSLIDGLTGAPTGGLGPAFGRAIARPASKGGSGGGSATGPMDGPGLEPSAPRGGLETGPDHGSYEGDLSDFHPTISNPDPFDYAGSPTPPPRNFDLPGGQHMTINDPTVGYSPDPGGQPTDAYGKAVGEKNPAAPAAKPNYRDGSTVNLPGWDSSRTDNTGKMEFGRFAQSKGGHITGDDVRQFVADNPDEWEIDPRSSHDDPHIRQKQSWLDNPANGDGKTGARSIWQDVIRDAGPGGANAAAFGNVEGDPALGYAAPEQQAELPGQTGAGPFGYLDPSLASNPMPNIQDALAAVQRPGTIQEIIARLQRGG